MLHHKTLATALFVLVSAGASSAQETTALTIYSTQRPGAVPVESYRPLPGAGPRLHYGSSLGFAVVKHERELELREGRAELRFTDVAALIEPTTVRFESLTDPAGTSVLEQSYQFDLVSQARLLERFLDEEITVDVARGDKIESITGRLLSSDGGLMLEDAGGGIRSLQSWLGVQYPQLPGGLMTRPTLVWDVRATRAGTHATRVTYQTEGITWWADYNLVFEPGADANSGTLDVGAWVSILNQSGATYADAKLKLIAGDVQRVQQPGQVYMRAEARAPQADRGFEEQAFFEYHLYTLGRPVTIADRATKQIELFDEARDIPVEKLLVYSGQTSSVNATRPLTDRNFGQTGDTKVDVYLRFANTDAAGLGIPLPSGRVRVNQSDPADGSLEFIGEDVIDHTPQGEPVQIRLGNAFDVVGERKQIDFRVDQARQWMEETIAIEVRNRKREAVRVTVSERLLRWVNWELLEADAEWTREDARTIHFPLAIAADSAARVTYKVRYNW